MDNHRAGSELSLIQHDVLWFSLSFYGLHAWYELFSWKYLSQLFFSREIFSKAA